MKNSKQTRAGIEGKAIAQLRQELWQRVHERKPLPILHPIPRLSVRPETKRSRLAEIGSFVQERIRTGAARLPLLAMIVAVLAGAGAGSGCTSLSYQSPNGERFTRVAVGNASAINALELETGTNGVRRIILKGFSSDSANALGVVTEAAVRAALTGH